MKALIKVAYNLKHYAGAAGTGAVLAGLSGARKREGESNAERLKRVAKRGLLGAGAGATAMGLAHGRKSHKLLGEEVKAHEKLKGYNQDLQADWRAVKRDFAKENLANHKLRKMERSHLEQIDGLNKIIDRLKKK